MSISVTLKWPITCPVDQSTITHLSLALVGRIVSKPRNKHCQQDQGSTCLISLCIQSVHSKLWKTQECIGLTPLRIEKHQLGTICVQPLQAMALWVFIQHQVAFALCTSNYLCIIMKMCAQCALCALHPHCTLCEWSGCIESTMHHHTLTQPAHFNLLSAFQPHSHHST